MQNTGLYGVELKEKTFPELTTLLAKGINYEACAMSFLCKIITHTTDGTNHSLSLCIQGEARLAEKAKLTLHCVNLYRKVFLQIFWHRYTVNC